MSNRLRQTEITKKNVSFENSKLVKIVDELELVCRGSQLFLIQCVSNRNKKPQSFQRNYPWKYVLFINFELYVPYRKQKLPQMQCITLYSQIDTSSKFDTLFLPIESQTNKFKSGNP